MIKLVTICTCSLSSQYGSGSAYLCCENKEIDQGSIYVFSFLINQRKLFWSIVEWYLRVKQCMVGTWREHE